MHKNKIRHALLWMCYFIFWMFVYRDYYPSLLPLFKVTFVYFLAHAGLYYFSQYYLIPNLLKSRGGPWLFILAYVSSAFLAALAMYWAIPLALGNQATEFFGFPAFQIILVFFMSNLSFVGLLLGVKALLTYRRNQRKMDLMEKERLESELQYLKAQVNPHFLFNTINSVYVLIKIDPDRASDTLIKLSELLRSQLYEFTGSNISIEKEIAYLKNYIDLEKLRREDNLKITFQVKEQVKDFDLPPLLLIPFLENCFKHLSSHQDQKNEVMVNLDYNQGVFEADFINTKESRNGSPETFGGLGIKNVQRRLDLLYPKSHHLEFQDLEDKFKVHLAIDMHGK